MSVTKKFLFIHIPKTAGTSIRQVLEPCGVTDYFSYSKGIEEYITVKNKFPPHLTYVAAADVLAVDLNRFYKFTFVRNPWGRFVSMYEYYRKDTLHAMHQRCMACSFEDFIDDVMARTRGHNYGKIGFYSRRNPVNNDMPFARFNAEELVVRKVYFFANILARR